MDVRYSYTSDLDPALDVCVCVRVNVCMCAIYRDLQFYVQVFLYFFFVGNIIRF